MVYTGTIQIISQRACRVIVSLPIGLNELFLGIWMIVNGFNSSAIASESANTDINRQNDHIYKYGRMPK